MGKLEQTLIHMFVDLCIYQLPKVDHSAYATFEGDFLKFCWITLHQPNFVRSAIGKKLAW